MNIASDLATELHNIALFIQAIGKVLIDTGLAVALAIAIGYELQTKRGRV
jgi:hypothetical protein